MLLLLWHCSYCYYGPREKRDLRSAVYLLFAARIQSLYMQIVNVGDRKKTNQKNEEVKWIRNDITSHHALAHELF